MRVLLTSTSGAGHFGPLVPFANAVRRAGHDVLVAAPVSAQPLVERAGLPFMSHADPPESELGPFWEGVQAGLAGNPNELVVGKLFAGIRARASLPGIELAIDAWRPDIVVRETCEFAAAVAAEARGVPQARVGAATPDEANEIVLAELFGRVRAAAALPGMELAMDAWRPDLVLRESCEFAGAVAGEARGIPVARVGIGTYAMESWAVRAAAPAVSELRFAAGLEPDPSGHRLAASPYLTLTPAAMEIAGGPEPAGALRFHDAAPPLRAVRAGDDDPLVYVSFGSVAPTMGFFPDLYRAVIDALAALPIRLLVTVGDAADPAALGPLPAHVRVERWIPQAAVFTEADAMVGHGGFGTTLGALLAAVPQVVVPLFADQPYNARQVEALGAGIAADAKDPAGIRAAVERLLDEPAFRVAAGRVALEAQGLPAIDEAPAALEAVAAAARRRRAA